MSKRYQGGVLGVGFNPLHAPNAPTIGTATAGDTTASVAFTAPANVGGSAITSYAVQSDPGGIGASGASSPITVSGLTNCTSYTFRATALNSYGPSPASAASNSVTPIVPTVGQDAYTTAGTFSWVAPAGVTSVSVVAVGGGGGTQSFSYSGGGGGALAYLNNISVTSGSSYTVIVGAGGAVGGSGGSSSFHSLMTAGGGGPGGSSATVGIFSGESVLGGNGGTAANSQGGGGAGGYSGTGGISQVAGSGGGGGGGGTGGWQGNSAGGGGVGLLGQGASGSGGGNVAVCGAVITGGGGGSGGASAANTIDGAATGVYGSNGGAYGGGAGGGRAGNINLLGGVGAVRIIYPGATRSFPSTNTGNL